LRVPAAAMVNLLGRRDGAAGLDPLPHALQFPTAQLHWYGKAESRVGRKMGHVTVTGQDVKLCLRTALAVDEAWAQ
ncbi:MAG TPA: 5-(carboxyamino)imidazole ribonucleotide synthase, partial [bacterium]|nr:5-(carboxyamino)imidazole ribonucleotide synthase [bacterium]